MNRAGHFPGEPASAANPCLDRHQAETGQKILPCKTFRPRSRRKRLYSMPRSLILKRVSGWFDAVLAAEPTGTAMVRSPARTGREHSSCEHQGCSQRANHVGRTSNVYAIEQDVAISRPWPARTHFAARARKPSRTTRFYPGRIAGRDYDHRCFDGAAAAGGAGGPRSRPDDAVHQQQQKHLPRPD